MKYPVVALFLAVLLGGIPVRAGDPITIDGQFQDWAEVPIAFTDQNGDGIDEDFDQLKITNDNRFLFILFSFNTGELLLQELNQIKLFIDTDNRAESGRPVHGIGAELEWCFGLRQGKFHGSAGEESIPHAQLTLRSAPTITSRIFEIAIATDSAPMTLAGSQVADTLKVVLMTSGGLDFLPDTAGGVQYIIDTTPVAEPESIPLARSQSDHVRILTYNTLFGGMLIPARQPFFRRIMLALNPDIMAFQEQDNHSAVKNVIAQWMQTQEMNLHSAGLGSKSIVSRFPILQAAFLTNSGRSEIVLLDTKSALGTDLVLINSHLSCCQNNLGRQRDADEIISILRDWRSTGNGPFPLQMNTPIIHLGDFNLVGSSFQLRTLAEGDIADEYTFGSDFAPDWDGTSLADLFSRHTSIRMGYTWRNDADFFTPGKLDYILYTDSVIELGSHFILNTLAMSETELETYGLHANDTNLASDHLPRIMDIVPPATVSVKNNVVANIPKGVHLFPAYPNPFNPTTKIRYSLETSTHVTLKVYNLLGREVAVLVDERQNAGDHKVVFDASQLANGVYLYTLAADDQTETRKAILAK
ncbi:T9SS type A sorting domain-containing protein [bacterium]|nr:T9SS type A sorting domain-containing protein [bacterium]